jgi:hypothetical protein
VIPPRSFPPGILQMYEVDSDGTKLLLQELPTSSRNRERMHTMRNDILIVNPTKTIIISENNAWV